MIDVYSKVLKLLSADNLKRAEIISRRSLKKYNDDRFYYLLAIIYFKKKIYKKSLININYFLRNSVVNKDGLILKIHILI